VPALAENRPRRRPDLVVRRRQIEDEVFYVVANPVTNEHLKLGEIEHAILDLLDGSRNMDEIAAAFEARTGSAIEVDDLAEFVESLREAGMVERAAFDPAQILEEFRQRERSGLARPQLVSGSLAFLRFLPFNPDRFLGAVASRISWVWTRGFFIASTALMAAATVATIAWFDRIWPAARALFESSVAGGGAGMARRLAILYVVGGAVVVIHECAHGLTLKHYGGTVPEMGFVLAYFQIPGAYTDTTSSYLLPQRYQRVLVSAAGGYIEMVMASAAVFLWWASAPGSLLNETALILILVAGPITLLFNWNPLVPFDGYYIFTDIFEAPNLMKRSFGYLGDLIRRKILRVSPVNPMPPVRLRRVFAVYGALSWAYQALWIVVVPYVAFLVFSRIFGETIGAALAAMVTIKFGRYPAGILWRLVRQVYDERARKWGRSPRKAGAAAALALAGAAVLFVPACPLHVHGDAVLRAERRVEARARTAGFVGEILAMPGERVEAGQPLVRLEDRDSASELAQARIERDEVKASMLRDEARGEIASATRLRARWDRLGREVDILSARLAGLTILSPAGGTVIGADLPDRMGTLLREGDLWCEVAEAGKLRAVLLVPETDLRDVADWAPAEAINDGFPGRRFAGHVSNVPAQGMEPRPPAALAGAAAASAPVSVYEVEVLLDNSGGVLRPGMSVEVRIEGERRSLAARAARAATDLLRGKIWW